MRYDPIDPQLFVDNRAAIAASLPEGSMAVIHANDSMPTNADAAFTYVQNSDLFYLCGVPQAETALILFPSHPDENMREVLFVTETTEHLRVWDGPKLDKEQARKHTGIKTVYWAAQFDGIFRQLMGRSDTVYFSLNEHGRSATSVQTRTERLIAKCKDEYPLHNYKRLAPTLYKARQVKSALEIDLLQKACDVTEAGFRRVLGFIKPGVGEWEIEAEFSHEFLRRRSHGFSYLPIIGSGENACVLHYLENNKVCQDGEMILMDVGAEYSRYAADMTRSVPVNGRFSERQFAVYNKVKDVLFAAQDLLKPGVILKEYEKEVGKLMDGALIDLGLLDKDEVANQDKDSPLRRKYFMHGTAHHLGLDVHDVGDTSRPLEPGMVLTCEPGIYIREENLGIRLENDIVVTENGNRNLMASIPIEPEEIEELMNA